MSARIASTGIMKAKRPQIIAARLAEPMGLVRLLAGLRAGDGDANWTDVSSLVSTVLKDGEATRLTLLAGRDDPAVTARFKEALPGGSVERKVFRGSTVRPTHDLPPSPLGTGAAVAGTHAAHPAPSPATIASRRVIRSVLMTSPREVQLAQTKSRELAADERR